jgi:predicted Rossmann-fold nucleotide-binding protein
LNRGRSVTIAYRWADGRSQRFAEVAAEFVRLKVDIIVTGGTPAVMAGARFTILLPNVPVGFGKS